MNDADVTMFPGMVLGSLITRSIKKDETNETFSRFSYIHNMTPSLKRSLKTTLDD